MPNEGTPEYGLIDAFGVDDGELDGLSPQECFALGVEWALVRNDVYEKRKSHRTVHRANVDRLQALSERHGLLVSVEGIDETWAYLKARKRGR